MIEPAFTRPTSPIWVQLSYDRDPADNCQISENVGAGFLSLRHLVRRNSEFACARLDTCDISAAWRPPHIVLAHLRHELGPPFKSKRLRFSRSTCTSSLGGRARSVCLRHKGTFAAALAPRLERRLICQISRLRGAFPRKPLATRGGGFGLASHDVAGDIFVGHDNQIAMARNSLSGRLKGRL